MNPSIIFDLDGTLLDTLRDLAQSANKVLQSHGFAIHDEQDYKMFVGSGLQQLITRIVPQASSDELIERCCQEFVEIYTSNWKSNCCPYPGVTDMLSTLKRRDIKMAVLSNKPHLLTPLFIDEFFPAETFELVYGQRPEFAKKPDPVVPLQIAAKLGTSPENTFFVGDSAIDMQTASNAGMRSVGVTWGFRSETELRDNKAEIIINHPLELLNYVIPSP
jgi:phosphoglycolate phosphatase